MSRNAFSKLEREYNEAQALREHAAMERGLICPYCGKELPDQQTPCCGEVGHGEEAETYDCPIHGLQQGKDCPRC